MTTKKKSDAEAKPKGDAKPAAKTPAELRKAHDVVSGRRTAHRVVAAVRWGPKPIAVPLDRLSDAQIEDLLADDELELDFH